MGEWVPVHQISTQVGFVTQLKGRITCKQYEAATIFVDHFSHLRYMHFHETLSSDETVQAKIAFEKFALCMAFKSNNIKLTMATFPTIP